MLKAYASKRKEYSWENEAYSRMLLHQSRKLKEYYWTPKAYYKMFQAYAWPPI